MDRNVPGALFQLPLWSLAAAITLVLVGFWVSIRLVKGGVSGGRKKATAGSPDWSVPPVVDSASGKSVFHRWDDRYKLASLFMYAFLVVSLKTLPMAALAVVISFLAVVAGRLPMAPVMRRVGAMAGFIGMFVVVMPLTVPTRATDSLLFFQGLPELSINFRGLQLALTIAAKAVAVAVLMEPLLATAPLSRTLEALNQLGVPRKITQMVLLCHRYIYVFLSEAKRMATGMQVRGFKKRTDLFTLRTVAYFLGMLFIRSFDRTYRVYDAMICRGYIGVFPTHSRFQADGWDRVFSAMWIVLGIVMVVVDHFKLISI